MVGDDLDRGQVRMTQHRAPLLPREREQSAGLVDVRADDKRAIGALFENVFNAEG